MSLMGCFSVVLTAVSVERERRHSTTHELFNLSKESI